MPGDYVSSQAICRFAQRPLVRRHRHALLRPPLAHQADGLQRRGLRRQAGDRHHQYLERHELVPRSSARARRGGQARGLAGRGLPGRDAGYVARRGVHEADDDDVPQPSRHGDRGAAARQSDRRRRAAGRLRQDGAGAPDGCGKHEPADDLRAGRADAARQLARQAARQRQRRVEILGRSARRPHRPARFPQWTPDTRGWRRRAGGSSSRWCGRISR